MNTSVKTFLNRASSTVTASVNLDKALVGANPKIITAAKKLGQHCKITHAQYEEGANAAMLIVLPNSDSSVSQGDKVFSVPEMGSITEFMSACASVGEAELHTSMDDRDAGLYIEIFTE